MILQQGDEHPWRRDDGVVEGVGQVHFPILALHAHFQPSRLGVAQIGAGADLEILLLAGAPGLDIAGFDLQVGQIAGAAFQLPHGDFHAAEQLHAHPPHFFVPVHAVLGAAHHDHFLFFKLVDAVHAALLDAVGALLLAEAGRIAGQGLGQLPFRDDLVDEPADHGVLAGADEIQVLPFDLVHHGVHLGEAHDAGDHVGADHKGRDAVSKAFSDHEIPGVGDDGLVQPGDVAQQIVEAVAGHPARRVHVDAVEALHDLRMVRDVKIGDLRLAEALQLHIVGVVRPDGDAGVDHLGNHHHVLQDLLAQLLLQLLQLLQPVGVGLDPGLRGLRLRQPGRVLFGLSHQHPHLLGQRVARRAQVARLGDGGAVPPVQLHHLVHQRQLGVLEFLPDVLFYSLGILPDKFYIQHLYYSLLYL